MRQQIYCELIRLKPGGYFVKITPYLYGYCFFIQISAEKAKEIMGGFGQNQSKATFTLNDFEINKLFDSLSDLLDFVNDHFVNISGYRDGFAVEYGDDKFSIDYASWNKDDKRFLSELQEIKKSDPSVKFVLKLR